MNIDQQNIIDSLVDVQKYLYTETFIKDKNNFAYCTECFDAFINSIRLAIGQHEIKEYLGKGK